MKFGDWDNGEMQARVLYIRNRGISDGGDDRLQLDGGDRNTCQSSMVSTKEPNMSRFGTFPLIR